MGKDISVITDSITKTNAKFLEMPKEASENLAFAFWLSIALLIFISLLKYFVSKECDKKDWGNFVLEFPIDVCLVVITIIITGVMKGPNLLTGIMLLIFSLIVSILCCMLRQASIKNSYNEKDRWKIYLYGSLDLLLALIWSSFIYIQYFKL